MGGANAFSSYIIQTSVRSMIFWVLYFFHGFVFKMSHFTLLHPGMGYAVAQLVEALRYKSECRGFDS